jgi:CBS domain-containing membrane protein
VPAPHWRYSLLSLCQATIAITILTAMDTYWAAKEDECMLIASFGASAVLLYSAVGSPLAQPRNLLLGHIISAFIGVCIQKVRPLTPSANHRSGSRPHGRLWCVTQALGSQAWAAGVGVGVAIFAMERLRCVHPPGGATALVAVVGSKSIHE